MKKMRILSVLVISCTLFAAGGAPQKRQESGDAYFKKWLDTDVQYIITEEERAVFQKLTTQEEKENFVEQFWRRRDPSPATLENEYRAEHYRRIAYANDKFGYGRPGWVSDRGRAYITLGPPDEIEQHPSGGTYDRRPSEGGGYTATYPFERWWYRHIAGVGDGIELEFVDPSWSGEYKLAFSPEEKDAHLHVAAAGPTLFEMMGFTARHERPYFKPGVLGSQAHQYGFQTLAKDSAFTRLEVLTNIQRPPEIKFKDLQQVVATKVTYQLLPFHITSTHVLAAPDRYLAPVTVLIDNSSLSFRKAGDLNTAQVNIFGQVTDLMGRTAAVFEDAVSTEFNDAQLARGLQLKSIYQRPLLLNSGRYKLNLVLKDSHSGRIGTLESSLVLPKISDNELAISPVIFSERLEPAGEQDAVGQPFVLGKLRVVPRIDNAFSGGNPVGIYFEIYQMQVDQLSGKPEVDVDLRVTRNGQEVKTADLFVWQRYDNDRIYYARGVDSSKLEPGRYDVRVEVKDEVANARLQSTGTFEVRP